MDSFCFAFDFSYLCPQIIKKMVKVTILNFRIVLSLVMMAMVVLAHKVISRPSLRNSLAQVRVNINKNRR